MRILILGGGGLGTVLSGYLARSGQDVTLFVKREHAAAFERSDVQITGLADFVAPLHIASDPHALGAYNYLLVCVKGRDTEAALAPLQNLEIETVLSLQNGVRKDETLVRLFGAGRVLGALTSVGGMLERPGHALNSLAGATLVGELAGGTSARGERLAEAIRNAGLPASCVPNIVLLEWYKLAGFLRHALLCSLTRRDVAAIALDPNLRRLGVELVQEIARVAAAEGQPLPRSVEGMIPLASAAEGEAGEAILNAPPEDLSAAFEAFGHGLRAQGTLLYPSLTQDIMAGKPTELEDTAGDLLTRAAHHGIAVPTLNVCTTLLRGIDRSTSSG